MLDESNPSNGDRFVSFAGMERDTVTGLNLAVEREENPGTGRWDSQDPLGFAARDANTYAYCWNSPVTMLDPFGLSDEPAKGMTQGDDQLPQTPGQGMILPPDPTGLPPGWVPDPTHRYPHGTRYRHPGGDYVDWHPSQPSAPQKKPHWHYNGGKKHLKPGDTIPEPKPAPPPQPRQPPPDPITTPDSTRVGVAGAMCILYWVVSEGTRVIPVRNLFPIP